MIAVSDGGGSKGSLVIRVLAPQALAWRLFYTLGPRLSVIVIIFFFFFNCPDSGSAGKAFFTTSSSPCCSLSNQAIFVLGKQEKMGVINDREKVAAELVMGVSPFLSRSTSTHKLHTYKVCNCNYLTAIPFLFFFTRRIIAVLCQNEASRNFIILNLIFSATL